MGTSLKTIVTIATGPHRKLYEQTDNPIHVWAAYILARRVQASG